MSVRCLLFFGVATLALGALARAQSYRIDGGARLTRLDAGGETALRVLAGRESGELRAWCAHRDGTAFVAAQNGLFVASPDVDVLDRIDLEGEPPPGQPVGVAPADDERIWLLTSEALCAVGTRQFLWRRVDLGPRAPTGEFTSLEVEPDGALRLRTATDSLRFEPARTPPPTVRVASVNGIAYRADAVFEARAGEALRVEFEASDGAVARWRNGDRFRWLEFDAAGAVAGQLPGRQSLRVVAFDDQLRRSQPVHIELAVAYPKALDTSTLTLIAVALGVLTLGGAALFTLRRGGGFAQLLENSLLAALTLCLGLQVVAALFPHAKGWPFIGFSMYTRTSKEHSVVYRQQFFGVLADGSRTPLAPPGGAYGKYETERALMPFVHDEGDARAKFLTAWNREHPARPLVGLLGLCQRRRLCAEGPLDVPHLLFFDTTPQEVQQ